MMKRIRENKVAILMGIILLIAAFLRIYRISDYMTFLGDEGRDALIAKGILEGHFTLLGPRASAGDFFTGPIYYYMMAPFLLLSGYDPIGPAIFIAVLSVITVFLIYRFGKEWFGTRAGIIAASLYAVSPLVIQYSRSSWNPNPMPFFSLIILYLLRKAMEKNSWKLFLFVGFLFGIAFQLHYIEVIMGMVIFFFLTIGSYFLLKRKQAVSLKKPNELLSYFRTILPKYALLLAGFFVGFSPFIAFEARHNFANTRTILTFMFVKTPQAEFQNTHATFLQIIWDVFFRLFGHLLVRFPSPVIFHQFSSLQLQVWWVLALVVAIVSVFFLFKVKDKLTVLMFSLWLFFGVVLWGVYHKNIYDYYFEFMFPLPFLLIGNALGEGLTNTLKKKWIVWLGVGCAVFLFIFNIMDWPFSYTPNRQRAKAMEAVDFIIPKTNNKPFNFAYITKGNSDHAYRYYFHIRDHDPVVIDNIINDPKRKTVTDQLFVICDFPNCHPLGHPLFDVASFGRAEIAGEWHVEEVDIYKLVHYKGK